MEDLRNYLRNSNGDIFEIINKAIRVAASDYPLEFQNNKHKIAETLYSSCSLIKCSGSDDKCKMDVVRELVANDGSSKNHIIQPPTETQIIPTSNKQQRTNVIRIKLKKKALDKTDGDTTSSLYHKRIAEILRIKGILDNSQGESESVVCELLSMVQYMGLGLDVLKVTGIGKTVNVLQRHASKDVNQIAKTLIKQWKGMVDERFENNSSGVKPTSEKQVKPTSLNMEQKFQTDSGKADNINGQVTLDQRKSKVMDYKVATKNQKGENSIEEKFEASKRKLQHNYEEAANMKKQRRVHVIEFHELSKHGLLPQQQRQLKSSNEQLKRRGNVHSRIHQLVPTY